MYLECFCGRVMFNTGSPNGIEHVLLYDYALEKLQALVNAEVDKDGTVDLWPEHREDSGALNVWKCPDCQRRYISPDGEKEKVIVYTIERRGM
jgi:hypothetical protein